jgi:hypothetical protein
MALPKVHGDFLEVSSAYSGDSYFIRIDSIYIIFPVETVEHYPEARTGLALVGGNEADDRWVRESASEILTAINNRNI